jgi:hypothetical protein
MPSKTAVIAYHYHVLSGHQQLFDQVESRICTAYRKGFSVVEITRIIGSKKADYAHAVLVKHKVISQGKRGRPAKDSVPPVMSSYLSRRSLSYAKWCAGWGFDIWDAGHAIRENADGPVLDAVRRDFPGCYVKLRKLKAYPDYVHPPQCRSNKLEAKVIWDDGEHCYRAEQIENSGVRGFRLSMEDAIRNLKVSHNFGLMLVRLEAGCKISCF